jgi:hypothetical protein
VNCPHGSRGRRVVPWEGGRDRVAAHRELRVERVDDVVRGEGPVAALVEDQDAGRVQVVR